MRKIWVLAGALALVASGGVAASAQAVQPDKIKSVSGPTVSDQYVVVLKSSTAEVKSHSFDAKGVKTKHKYDSALNGLAVTANRQQIEQISADPDVAEIYPDGLVSSDKADPGVGTQPVAAPDAVEPAVSGCQSVPNPPNSPWGLDRIDEHFFPLENRYCWPFVGSAVRAYVIDTGIQTNHPQFQGRALAVADFVGDGRSGQDCNGHGTHVAGTIGGSAYGVAKGVKLRSVRVFGCSGSASYSTIIAAVDWVSDNAIKPAVVNMSLGGSYYAPLNTAVTNSINRGIQYSVAAGNSNDNSCNYSPASASGTVTVGATGNFASPSAPRTDVRSSYSNWGACTNIFAPGTYIKSAWLNGGTNTISGTSMATPHVTGVLALLLARSPGASPATLRSQLFNDSTKGQVGDERGAFDRLAYVRQ
jgi:subtilisin family serine protease